MPEDPRKGVPFAVIIEALTCCRVLPFDTQSNRQLLAQLRTGAATAVQLARRKGITAGRPNEAGNQTEPFLQAGLQLAGIQVDRPASKGGNNKVAGYPNLEIRDRAGRIAYVECKTYARGNKDQTFRSFYLSLTDDPKITKDAFHLLIAFELEFDSRRNVYIPSAWGIWTLDRLMLQIKYEFNASNRQIYASGALRAEGNGEAAVAGAVNV
jgi:hypothetical protein